MKKIEIQCEHLEQEYVPVAVGEGERLVKICLVCEQEILYEDPEDWRDHELVYH